MIEYIIIENLPFGGELLFYLFYTWVLLVLCLHSYFKVDGIRIDLEYERKEKSRLIKQELESKYADFIYSIKATNFFYRYWRIV